MSITVNYDRDNLIIDDVTYTGSTTVMYVSYFGFGIASVIKVNMHCCLCTELYTAIYTYTSDEPGDLTFNEGDVISVVRTEGDWWTGNIGQRSGIFPGNFVKKYEEHPVAAAAPVEEVELACICIVAPYGLWELWFFIRIDPIHFLVSLVLLGLVLGVYSVYLGCCRFALSVLQPSDWLEKLSPK